MSPPIVVVTGARGFLGRHLVLRLQREGVRDVRTILHTADDTQMEDSLQGVDYLFHMAGVNRAEQDESFQTGNVEFLRRVLAATGAVGVQPAVVLPSSIHSGTGNIYGATKAAASQVLRNAAAEGSVEARIYCLPGVFGPYARPKYNSFVATLCDSIANDANYTIDDRSKEIPLVYVADVVATFYGELDQPVRPGHESPRRLDSVRHVRLGWIEDLLREFREHRKSLRVPDLADPLARQLYASYVSYLPPERFSYPLVLHSDERGDLAELLKSEQAGQLFVSRTNPGVTRGGHYHDTKTEKFIVVEGSAEIRLQHVFDGRSETLRVDGADPVVVDIVPGWAHTLTNIGDGVMITIFWASEVFSQESPDTYRWPLESS